MKSLNKYLAEALDGSKMTYSGKNQDFVDVILENPEGKILILRRANYMKNFRTCWGVIGGAVDVADKTLKDAAVRETVEETGISLSFNEVNNMKQLFDYKYKDGNVSHVFWTRLETKIDKVKISREHSKYEWIDFSEEKIDDRKWMPEVFNILQKWEQTPVNERLIINKNYNDASSSIDDLIKKYVDLGQGVVHSEYTINLKYNIEIKIKLLAENHSLLFGSSETNKWKNECMKHIHFDDDKKGYTFNSGELVRTCKVKSLMPNAESIEKLISHIDEGDKQIIYSEEDIDGTLFEVFYVTGEQYTFVTLGSTELRYSYITLTKKN